MELENGKTGFTCECTLLSPTSMVNDISAVFEDSKVDEIFSDKVNYIFIENIIFIRIFKKLYI